MNNPITAIKRLFTHLFSQNQYKIQTFTYFIPAPKPRKTGYREKQFDKVFYEFINRGYRVIEFKTQQCTVGQETSGIWLIFIVQAINAQAEKLNLDEIDLDSSLDEVTSHKHGGHDHVPAMPQFQEAEETFIELPEAPEDYPDEVQGLYEIKDK